MKQTAKQTTMKLNRQRRLLCTALLIINMMLAGLPTNGSTKAALQDTHAVSIQTDIAGPTGSGAFGTSVTVLPNGNIVVTDPAYNAGIGAVYLYNGTTLEIISTLTGSSANDNVGSNGITVLTNGNYIVKSSVWNNGTVIDAGAITWCSATTGLNGTVSLSNSLVGSSGNDQIGGTLSYDGVIALPNGNYVVSSVDWDNPSLSTNNNAGAVTWGNGAGGTVGVVSVSNSLIGSSANDMVGGTFANPRITVLSNSNYVVSSPNWDNPSLSTNNNAGAVTWGNGAGSTVGVVGATNSLIGGSVNDQVGSDNGINLGIFALTNGSYVISSPNWDNPSPVITNVGAVTWGNGAGGTIGVVSSANSLVGGKANDKIGTGFFNDVGMTILNNGNYVVSSPVWDNPALGFNNNAGAVTWGNGSGGTSGLITSANSLIGSTADDNVGSNSNHPSVIALTNGNYVVSSPGWDNPSPPTFNAGAVTWSNGTSGITGFINSANSLIGGRAVDVIGSGGVIALTNSNYVVSSPGWTNPSPLQVGAGAVTWGNGTSGTIGIVNSANSLIGGSETDGVGNVTALVNGNYVVSSPSWDTPSLLANNNVGAVTLGNGATGTIGVVTSTNSLIGGSRGDLVGNNGITPLANGNYVVNSLNWNNPSPVISSVGAITWGSGTSFTVGVVSAANSLIGGTLLDFTSTSVIALTNGNYVVSSPAWDNPSLSANNNAGAVTWGNGAGGTAGLVSSANSLVSSTRNSFVGKVTVLNNGNYVVSSPNWDNPSLPVNNDAGAVTWGNGTGGTVGIITSSNSLIGSTVEESIGIIDVTTLNSGNYVVNSPGWDNGTINNAGAVTWGNGTSGTNGLITSTNSVLGTAPNGISNFTYDTIRNRLIVGRSASNIVSIFNQTGGTGNNSNDSNDFDGDDKTDIAVWRPTNGVWYILNSLDSSLTATGWGINGDVIIPGDYDGDGKTDIAVRRPSNGVWYIRNSSNGSSNFTGWGTTNDVAVPGDYDGDNKTDIAVWRPSTGLWYILRTSDGQTSVINWGANGDKPVAADYDGDNKTDIAVWRPSNGTWYILNSANGSLFVAGWGISTDKPVPGDFDGDGKGDIAIWRESNGTWYIRNSSTGGLKVVGWGNTGDVPVSGDFDGDSKTDAAVWRGTTGTWFILNSSNGSNRTVVWGTSGDVPVPSAFVR